jgi:hypothetical protein
MKKDTVELVAIDVWGTSLCAVDQWGSQPWACTFHCEVCEDPGQTHHQPHHQYSKNAESVETDFGALFAASRAVFVHSTAFVDKSQDPKALANMYAIED